MELKENIIMAPHAKRLQNLLEPTHSMNHLQTCSFALCSEFQVKLN